MAVVIVNYRTAELAKSCVMALARERPAFKKLTAVLVDGGSDDGSSEILSRFANEPEFANWLNFLALPVNGGFGWANNQAIHRLIRSNDPPEYIYLVNPDAEIGRGAVSRLAEYLDTHDRVAAVGSQLLETDGRLSGSAFTFPSISTEFARGARTGLLERLFRVKPTVIKASEPTEVDWVTGASVMFRAVALREAGLFDEGFFLYHEEVELMWRLRKKGWLIAIEPRSRVRHIGGAATGVHSSESGSRITERKPTYLYRSRARFFGLTGGPLVALAAFTAWIAGNAVWKARRVLRLAPSEVQVEHEFKDHLLNAFPRRHDFEPAAPSVEFEPTDAPTWMRKGWL